MINLNFLGPQATQTSIGYMRDREAPVAMYIKGKESVLLIKITCFSFKFSKGGFLSEICPEVMNLILCLRYRHSGRRTSSGKPQRIESHDLFSRDFSYSGM